jgi:hypothetical protein
LKSEFKGLFTTLVVEKGIEGLIGFVGFARAVL